MPLERLVWRRSDEPRGLLVQFGDADLYFNYDGHLVGVRINDGKIQRFDPARLAKRIDINDEMHLVFESSPKKTPVRISEHDLGPTEQPIKPKLA